MRLRKFFILIITAICVISFCCTASASGGGGNSAYDLIIRRMNLIDVAANASPAGLSYSPMVGMNVLKSGNCSVAYNLSECLYRKGGVVYYRLLDSEQTYVLTGSGVVVADNSASRQMSTDVFNLTGVDIRRTKLITDDILDGCYYGVCSPDFYLNQPIPQGPANDFESDNESGSGDDFVLQQTGKSRSGDGDASPAVPTPPVTPQPVPEVPIVTPVVE